MKMLMLALGLGLATASVAFGDTPPAAEERFRTLPPRIRDMVKLSPACVDSATRMPALPPIPRSNLPTDSYAREMERRNAVLATWIDLATVCKRLAALEAVVTEEALEQSRKDYPESAGLFRYPEFDPVRPDVWLETVYELTDKLVLLKKSEDKRRELEQVAQSALAEADGRKRAAEAELQQPEIRGAPAQPPLPDAPVTASGMGVRAVARAEPVKRDGRPPGWRLLTIATGPYGTSAFLQDGAGTRWMADRLGKLGAAEVVRIAPTQVVIIVDGRTLTFNTTR